MKTKYFKETKAITLIALIVSIIVLLILAGVSIAVLTGENGILNRATSAKTTNEQKTAEEELKLGVSALSIDYRKNTTNSQTFREFVTSNSGANLKTAMGLATDNQDLVVENATNGVVSYKGQKYQVDNYGGVKEYVKPTYTWTQNKTAVTNGEVNLTVGQAVTGYSVTVNNTEIGDGKWFVLGAKDGKLLITTDIYPEKVQLAGKNGHAEGIVTLNAAAEKYTNSYLADGNARSINVDDINRVTGYNPDVAQYNAGANNISQWNNDVTYTLNNGKIYYKGTKYPQYEENQLGAESSNGSFEYWNGSDWITLGDGTNPTSATITLNNYCYYPNTLTTSSSGDTVGIATDSPAYILLFSGSGVPNRPWEGGSPYWLASQCVGAGSDYAFFGIRVVSERRVYHREIFRSSGITDGVEYGLRPVVALASDVEVTSEGAISK